MNELRNEFKIALMFLSVAVVVVLVLADNENKISIDNEGKSITNQWKKTCTAVTLKVLKFRNDVSIKRAFRNPGKVIPVEETCKKVVMYGFLSKMATTIYIGVVSHDKKTVSVVKTLEVTEEGRVWVWFPILIAALSMVAFKVSFARGLDNRYKHDGVFVVISLFATIATFFFLLDAGITSGTLFVTFIIIFFIPLCCNERWLHRRIEARKDIKILSTMSLISMGIAMIAVYL